mmetsp:Transcript_17907/g.37479  ORF Transcript_17907/g.37479 Transcript_17907/m.37479 type:complete len:81 (-) Transcript_17907:437-679(-)
MATPNLVFCESSKNGDDDGCDFGFVFIEKGSEGRITDDDDDDDDDDDNNDPIPFYYRWSSIVVVLFNHSLSRTQPSVAAL